MFLSGNCSGQSLEELQVKTKKQDTDEKDDR